MEDPPPPCHISLVDLLAACAEGADVYTEIKCTSLLPLEDVVSVVTHGTASPRVGMQRLGGRAGAAPRSCSGRAGRGWEAGEAGRGAGGGRAGHERESLAGAGAGAVPLAPDLPALPQVKVAYVNFVNHCYVDTEGGDEEIYTSNHIWTLFENFTLDMARVLCLWERGPDWPLEGTRLPPVMGREWRRSPGIGLFYSRFAASVRRLADPAWKCVLTWVVLDTISAFFSSPFSENSTSLQVGAWAASGQGEPEYVHIHVALRALVVNAV